MSTTTRRSSPTNNQIEVLWPFDERTRLLEGAGLRGRASLREKCDRGRWVAAGDGEDDGDGDGAVMALRHLTDTKPHWHCHEFGSKSKVDTRQCPPTVYVFVNLGSARVVFCEQAASSPLCKCAARLHSRSPSAHDAGGCTWLVGATQFN